MVAVGAGVTVVLTEGLVPEHPFKVTVPDQLPAVLTVMVCVVAPFDQL